MSWNIHRINESLGISKGSEPAVAMVVEENQRAK